MQARAATCPLGALLAVRCSHLGLMHTSNGNGHPVPAIVNNYAAGALGCPCPQCCLRPTPCCPSLSVCVHRCHVVDGAGIGMGSSSSSSSSKGGRSGTKGSMLSGVGSWAGAAGEQSAGEGIFGMCTTTPCTTCLHMTQPPLAFCGNSNGFAENFMLNSVQITTKLPFCSTKL